MTVISRRYEFVLLFDISHGNPNGDPDAGNMPRLDPETHIGLVTDVCVKRKIRNFVELTRGDEPGLNIYVKQNAVLNEMNRRAFAAVRGDDAKLRAEKRLNPRDEEEERALQLFMCANFFDVRAFGAVMSTRINCGQVRGPVQLSFARSVEPVMPMEVTITRMSATTQSQPSTGKDGSIEDRVENKTIGRKFIIPYGLYRMHGFISAKLAEKTGFAESDLSLLWSALMEMFEHDRSASRGEMTTRKLIIFEHASALGNIQAHSLFERVCINRQYGGNLFELGNAQLHNLPPARSYTDYVVSVDYNDLENKVRAYELV